MDRKQISKMLMKLLLHKRVLLFWGVAAFFLVMPWLLKSCGRPAVLSSQVYENCAVLSIHDGDTMTVNCDGQGMKVRLYCIDAPELGQKPWGRASRDYLRSITSDQVKVIARTKDRYGRLVGEVLSNDQPQKNYNIFMVLNGYAAVYPRYCNDQHYYQAEKEAKETGSNIWGKPGVHQAPWSWRK
ncbi:MAG: thermonuclease family protein [Candidatus Thiodiazotropha sp.]